MHRALADLVSLQNVTRQPLTQNPAANTIISSLIFLWQQSPMKTLFNVKPAVHLGPAEHLALHSYLSRFPLNVPFDSILDLAIKADSAVSVHSNFVEVPRDELATSIRSTRRAAEARINAMLRLYSAAKAWIEFIDTDEPSHDHAPDISHMLADLQGACEHMESLF